MTLSKALVDAKVVRTKKASVPESHRGSQGRSRAQSGPSGVYKRIKSLERELNMCDEKI